MKRVVILSELIGGGVEKVNRLLAENLNKEEYDVTVIGISGRGKGEAIINGFSYESLNIEKQSKAFFKVIKKLKMISPDVVISCGSYDTYYSLIYSNLINRKSKSIYVHHSVYSSNLGKKSFSQKIIHHYIPKVFNLFNLCDGIIYVSNGVKEDFERVFRIDIGKSHIIYNPIIDNNINFNSCNLSNTTNNKIVTIGRLEEEKDQAIIIQAIKYLKDKGYEFKLSIIGQGSLENKLKELVNKLDLDNQVEFLGYKEDIYNELVKNNIFVLSSKHESFGNVIVEAMFAGVPVISTDCIYGPKEIIKDDEYGFLVPVGDYKSLADKILLVSKHSNESLIKKAKDYSLNFTIEQSVKSYEEVLKSI